MSFLFTCVYIRNTPSVTGLICMNQDGGSVRGEISLFLSLDYSNVHHVPYSHSRKTPGVLEGLEVLSLAHVKRYQ